VDALFVPHNQAGVSIFTESRLEGIPPLSDSLQTYRAMAKPPLELGNVHITPVADGTFRFLVHAVIGSEEAVEGDPLSHDGIISDALVAAEASDISSIVIPINAMYWSFSSFSDESSGNYTLRSLLGGISAYWQRPNTKVNQIVVAGLLIPRSKVIGVQDVQPQQHRHLDILDILDRPLQSRSERAFQRECSMFPKTSRIFKQAFSLNE
jgi:hypothetical protein